MCFFACVKSWEGGLFGIMVLFGSYSYFATEAWLSSLTSIPSTHLSLHFTRSRTFLTLTVRVPSLKVPLSQTESLLTGRLKHECGGIQ